MHIRFAIAIVLCAMVLSCDQVGISPTQPQLNAVGWPAPAGCLKICYGGFPMTDIDGNIAAFGFPDYGWSGLQFKWNGTTQFSVDQSSRFHSNGWPFSEGYNFTGYQPRHLFDIAFRNLVSGSWKYKLVVTPNAGSSTATGVTKATYKLSSITLCGVYDPL